MQRAANVLLYLVMGLVLAASLGAAALAFSADPKQFLPTGLSTEQQLDAEVELGPMMAGGPDELRIRYWSYSGWEPNSAGLVRVTQDRIETFRFEDGSWGRRWALVARASAKTPVADQVLGLLGELRDQERPDDDGCISHGGGSIVGRVDGKLFDATAWGCQTPPVQQRIWTLIKGVPELKND